MSKPSSQPPREQLPGDKQDENLSMADLSLTNRSRSRSHPLPGEQEPTSSPPSNPPDSHIRPPSSVTRSRSQATQSSGSFGTPNHDRATGMNYQPSFDPILHPPAHGVYVQQHASGLYQFPPQTQGHWQAQRRPQSPSFPLTRAASAGATITMYQSGTLGAHATRYGDVASSGSVAPSSRDSTVQPENSGSGPYIGHDVANMAASSSSISMRIQHPSPSDEGSHWSRSLPLGPSPTPSDQGSPSPGGAFGLSAAREHNSDLSPPSSKKKSSKRHSCPVCQKAFPRPSGLKTHLNTHSKAKPFKCPDPDCNKTFSVRSNAKRHYRIHGGDPNELHPSQLSISSGNELQFSEPQVVHPHPAAGASNLSRPIRWTNPRTVQQAPSTSQPQLDVPSSSAHEPTAFSGSGFTSAPATQAGSSSQGFQANHSTQDFGFGRQPQY